MDIHKNARLTLRRREDLVQSVTRGVTLRLAAGRVARAFELRELAMTGVPRPFAGFGKGGNHEACAKRFTPHDLRTKSSPIPRSRGPNLTHPVGRNGSYSISILPENKPVRASLSISRQKFTTHLPFKW